MKMLLVGFLTCVLALSATATEKPELEKRIRTIIEKLDEMQVKSDKRIPADVLKKAYGIVLMNRTKGGLVFGYENGYGVALVKDGKAGKWSPVSFVDSHEGSFGVQAGGQNSFVAIVLMTPEGARTLVDSKTDFGGQAQGTAGNGSGTEDSTEGAKAVLIFSDRKGFYGGATVKGGAIAPSSEDNNNYYGKPFTVDEILFKGKAKATPLVNELTKKLTDYAKDAKDSKDSKDSKKK